MDVDPSARALRRRVRATRPWDRRRRDRRLAMCSATTLVVLGVIGGVSCGGSRGRGSQVVKTVATPGSRSTPSQADIAVELHRTVELSGSPPATFEAVGAPLSVGTGTNALTAVIGRRTPSADGAGQLVFFWAGSRFVGWDSDTEALRIDSIAAQGDGVAVTYEGYSTTDPICCPSQPPIVVAYRWDGARVIVIAPTPPIRRGQGVKYQA